MYHFPDFVSVERCSCDHSMIIEIQKPCRHDLDKISTFCSRFLHSLVKFLHITEAPSDDPAIMSFFMDSKNRCPIVDPVFSGNLKCPL